jgi:hypothetical protein
LLSQETAGGDQWCGWPQTLINNNPADFIIPAAASSADLSTFNIYTNGADPRGNSFGPVTFDYFAITKAGVLIEAGGFTNAINSCMSTNGGSQYQVSLVSLSSFPNYKP